MRTTGISLLTSPNSPPISFTLRDTDKYARYSVREVTGLDAEDITHKYYGTGLVTQPKYYEAMLGPRDIVMSISLEPRFAQDETYSDVRDSLYRAISPGRLGQVELQFTSGGTVIAAIRGFVSRLEATHFAQKPEVQLTFTCPDPIFRATNPVVILGADLPTTDPLRVVDGMSTAHHGFHLHATFNTASATFTMQDDPTNPEWKFKLVPFGGFVIGDVLHLETDYMQNHLYLVRGGTTIHLVDTIEPGSIWPVMFHGVNEFYIPERSKFTWGDLTYFPAYWGV